MAGSQNGGRNGNRNNGSKRTDNKLIDNLRGYCPPWKVNDLDLLVKQLHGDEEKIRQKIQEWWDEPAQAADQEVWEDVNKRGHSGKRRDYKQNNYRSSGGRVHGGGRANSGGPGRGARGRREGGGRGGGGRGSGGRSGDRKSQKPPVQTQQKEDLKPKEIENAVPVPEGPAPVTTSNAPKGAWGIARGAPFVDAPTVNDKPVPQPKAVAPVQPKSVEPGMVTNKDPMPSGLAPITDKPTTRSVPVTGNVWATKGSAHLIQAEKPKPPPVQPVVMAPAPSPVVAPPIHQPPAQVEPEIPPVVPPPPVEPEVQSPVQTPVAVDVVSPTLESGLPPAVTRPPPSATVWKQGPPKATPPTSLEIPESPVEATKAAPLTSIPPMTIAEEAVVASPKPPAPVAVAPKPPRVAPPNVLNMGHWETGDIDDSQNLDFGFGSFGHDNEAGSMEATTASSSSTNNITSQAPPSAQGKEDSTPSTAPTNTVPQAAVSPARPPPGLSIGGMPPMPANAVLVHELENKLDGTSLNTKPEPSAQQVVQEKPISASLPPQPAQVPGAPTQALPSAGAQQNPTYNQYGMGVYNYNAAAAGNGFVGVHTPGPFLAGAAGVIPQQPLKQGGITAGPVGAAGAPQNLQPQQGSLYGAHQTAPSQGTTGGAVDSTGNSSSENNNSVAGQQATPGIPPGMPNMPYTNPALYYQQQPFLQHQQGISYNYGYGGFAGAVQGAFGYQQVMGQSGAYGPPYEDQPPNQPNSLHQPGGGSGGYQPKSRRPQYAGQYNPGAFTGPPYYDHFNQRGGYGFGSMGDPYGGMQQGSSNYQSSGGMHSGPGFQDEDHHKGKKGGGNRSNGGGSHSLNHFQPGPPNQLSGHQQQPFGLAGADTNPVSGSAGGGAGGWSNNHGGWSGGTPSWQQGS